MVSFSNKSHASPPHAAHIGAVTLGVAAAPPVRTYAPLGLHCRRRTSSLLALGDFPGPPTLEPA